MLFRVKLAVWELGGGKRPQLPFTEVTLKVTVSQIALAEDLKKTAMVSTAAQSISFLLWVFIFSPIDEEQILIVLDKNLESDSRG